MPGEKKQDVEAHRGLPTVQEVGRVQGMAGMGS